MNTQSIVRQEPFPVRILSRIKIYLNLFTDSSFKKCPKSRCASRFVIPFSCGYTNSRSSAPLHSTSLHSAVCAGSIDQPVHPAGVGEPHCEACSARRSADLEGFEARVRPCIGGLCALRHRSVRLVSGDESARGPLALGGEREAMRWSTRTARTRSPRAPHFQALTFSRSRSHTLLPPPHLLFLRSLLGLTTVPTIFARTRDVKRSRSTTCSTRCESLSLMT